MAKNRMGITTDAVVAIKQSFLKSVLGHELGEEVDASPPNGKTAPWRLSLLERTRATDWDDGNSILRYFPLYKDCTKHGDLRPPKAMLAQFRRTIQKAHATVKWRRCTKNQQLQLKPRFVEMERQARDAENKRKAEQKKVEKRAERARKAREKAHEKEIEAQRARDLKKRQAAARKASQDEERNRKKREANVARKKVRHCCFFCLV